MMAVANKTAIALDKAISNRKKYLNTFNNLKKRNIRVCLLYSSSSATDALFMTNCKL